MIHLDPAAPAWAGDLRSLSEEVLRQRDRELAMHISAILVHYDCRGSGPFRSATPAEQRQGNLNHWIAALTEVRNEMDRRFQSGDWEPHSDTQSAIIEGDRL